ncbi:hypothetical protein JCM19039_3191 [Geomicrobium sp. JCM 19039]|nr:hypothetical protein JCM19039_3191 [Geomicrobium sp. JCM 19039]
MKNKKIQSSFYIDEWDTKRTGSFGFLVELVGFVKYPFRLRTMLKAVVAHLI